MLSQLASNAPSAASTMPAGQLVEERPPAGLAQGKYPAAPWLVGLLGSVLVLSALGTFALRLWQRHQRSRSSPLSKAAGATR